MPRIAADTLRSVTIDVLSAAGAPVGTAETVANSLVTADSQGRTTHGVGILPLYARMIDDDAIAPTTTPEIVAETGCTVAVDGNGAFGQVTGHRATEAGMTAATEFGAGIVGIRDGTHLGRVGEFAERAAAEGFVFLAFTNTGGGAINVAVAGGSERKLSTNPVAFGFPTFDALEFDIVVDMATSQVSGSVPREHHRTGSPLHEEWTTTASGAPVESPTAFMEGNGALLPLGGRTTGHKGYALALAAELLGGLIGSNPVAGEREPEWFSNGAAFVVVESTVFLPVSEIETRVLALADHLSTEEGVRFPGERAWRRQRAAENEGVKLPVHVIVSLCELAIDLDVAVAEPLLAVAEDADAGFDDEVRSW